jgi:tetratricopeptide (TPR) repeat protein
MSNEQTPPPGEITFGDNSQSDAINSRVQRSFLYQAAQLRHAEHYLQVLYETRKLYEQGGEAIKLGLALFDLEWSNVQVGWEWAKHHANTIPRALELCSEYPRSCTYVAAIRQHLREQIAWREVALSAAKKLGRKDAQSWHLGNLGIAYHHLGEHGYAIKFYEQWLAITLEIGDRKGEGESLICLGIANKELGETRRAIEFYEQSLAICRETGDRRNEGNTLNNLGIANMELGETQRAIEFYEQSLLIKREIGDRFGEGQTLCNLGLLYVDLGEIQRAIEFYAQDLAITREIGNRRGECTALWNTALALNELGARKQAIASAEAALVICEQIEHPGTSEVREKLEVWRGETPSAQFGGYPLQSGA